MALYVVKEGATKSDRLSAFNGLGAFALNIDALLQRNYEKHH